MLSRTLSSNHDDIRHTTYVYIVAITFVQYMRYSIGPFRNCMDCVLDQNSSRTAQVLWIGQQHPTPELFYSLRSPKAAAIQACLAAATTQAAIPYIYVHICGLGSVSTYACFGNDDR